MSTDWNGCSQDGRRLDLDRSIASFEDCYSPKHLMSVLMLLMELASPWMMMGKKSEAAEAPLDARRKKEAARKMEFIFDVVM